MHTLISEHGFLRVAAAVPQLKVADVSFNTQEIIAQILKAQEQGVQILTFPELSITGYTCGDLFTQDILLSQAKRGLETILASIQGDIIFILGMPLPLDNQLFNVGVVAQQGKVLGVIPKTYLPGYGEFYEERQFASADDALSTQVSLGKETVPFGTNIIFHDVHNVQCAFGVELCEDAWVPIPPSAEHSLAGSLLTFNLSASNEVVGKAAYREQLVRALSAQHISGYVYASAGVGESSTDLMFGGASFIAENGTLLQQGERLTPESQLTVADVDTQKLLHDRRTTTSYMHGAKKLKTPYRKIPVQLADTPTDILRTYEKTPFVPSTLSKRAQVCEEILNIQASGLAKRLQHTGIQTTVIGISGGLDSTLAFLVIMKAYEKLGISPKQCIAITMPGFGTTGRTYQNALQLVQQYGASFQEISVKDASLQHFKDIGHNPDVHDITYENTQARERTQILMDIANKKGGLVIGTGDLSELALGRCTYNGDHMSMYAVNTSVPKTLVRYLVDYVAQQTKNADLQQTLKDILDTPVSPELLPPDLQGNLQQKTEDTVGPYELHDFFLYHFMRYGASPRKIFDIAMLTFQDDYSNEEIKKRLKVFLKRFFAQQFKRSCLPDGPKVGSVSLSPRGDWRMPSDAQANVRLEEVEKISW